MQLISRINRGLKEAFYSTESAQASEGDSDATTAVTDDTRAEGSASREMELDAPEWKKHIRDYTDFTRKDEEHEESVKALVDMISSRELQLLDLVRETFVLLPRWTHLELSKTPAPYRSVNVDGIQ